MHSGVLWRPRNAPLCTYMPMLRVCQTVFHVTIGGKAKVWGAIAPLPQGRIAPSPTHQIQRCVTIFLWHSIIFNTATMGSKYCVYVWSDVDRSKSEIDCEYTSFMFTRNTDHTSASSAPRVLVSHRASTNTCGYINLSSNHKLLLLFSSSGSPTSTLPHYLAERCNLHCKVRLLSW